MLLHALAARLLGPLPAAAQAVTARNGMVVAQEARAAQIGVEVLEHGGNAVDAAVAIGFAMAVTYPRAGNIGGGGFMVIHLAAGRRDVAIDYRETAPAATTRDIFLDAERRGRSAQVARLRRSRSACPARSRGWRWRMRRYGSGKFTLADLIAPAIELARDGIPIEDDVADSLPGVAAPRGALAVVGEDLPQARRQRARRPATRWCSAISPTRWRRSRATARAPSTKVPIADKIVAAVQAAGGIMTARRPQETIAPIDAQAGARHAIAATTSSRCRRRRPAAWC